VRSPIAAKPFVSLCLLQARETRVIVAGKGHETYQVIENQTFDFDGPSLWFGSCSMNLSAG